MGITTILVFALFLFFIVGALYHPIIGIMGYFLVYLNFNPYIWWCVSIFEVVKRPSLVVMIVLLISVVVHSGKLNWSFTRREIEIYLFLAVAFVVSVIGGIGVHEETWLVLDKMTKTFIFIFVFVRVVHKPIGIKIVIWTIIVNCIFLGFQGHQVGQFETGRLELIGGAEFQESNALALCMGFAIILMGFEILRATKLWKKALMIPGIAILIDTLVLTRSRAGFLGIIFAAPFVFAFSPRKYLKVLILYGVLGGLLILMLMDQAFIDRMNTITSSVDSVREQEIIDHEKPLDRIDFWLTSIAIFKDHPWGIGVRSYERIVNSYDYRNKGRDPHNTYILIYTETGIVGILVFLIIIFESFFSLRKDIANSNKVLKNDELSLYGVAFGASLILYLMGGMTTHSYVYNEIVWILFALPICYTNAVKYALMSRDNIEGLTRPD